MKSIKIVESNRDKIEASLHAVNGRARQHAYTDYSEVAELTKRAEARMLKLGIAKSHHKDAKFRAVSGQRVPNAYKYARQATFVALERRSSAWWLVEVAATDIYKEGGHEHLYLTPVQDDIAVSALRTKYAIQTPPEAA